MDSPPSHSSSYTSFPILAISILGILTTAILLLSYYLFIIKCCLHWRRADLLPFRFPSHRGRRHADLVRLHADPHPHETRGLDQAAIRSIPTLRFTKAGRQSPVECAVCLAEFEEHELLRLLPGCNHSFHIDCIDTWLESSANCPLCRFDISRVPIHNFTFPDTERDPSVVIEVNAGRATDNDRTPVRTTPKVLKQRKFWQVASMGDECIDISREKDERFVVQPIRRSFSMDSSNDRSLFLSVQEILHQNRELLREVTRGEGSSTNGGGGSNASGRIRRSFFSFGRSSRSATTVLPVQNELWQ